MYILFSNEKIEIYYKVGLFNIKYYSSIDIKEKDITNKNYLSEIVSDYLEYNSIKPRYVKIIWKLDTITRIISYPTSNSRYIKYIIYNNLEYDISIDLRLYTFDYKILNSNKSNTEVLVFLVKTKILENYIKIFDTLNIKIKVIDVYHNLLISYFQKLYKNKNILIFTENKDKIIILFIEKGRLSYIKEIEEDTLNINNILSIYRDINKNLEIDELYIEEKLNIYIINYLLDNNIKFKYLDKDIFLKFYKLF